MSLDLKAKQMALRQFTTGVYIIGSRGHGGALNVTVANWVNQVSFHPPLVAVAIKPHTLTRQLIEQGQVFSVNVLRADEHGAELAGKCVKPARHAPNKLEAEDYTTGETGAPRLSRALSWAECRVVAAHPAGDHVLYLGEVVGAGVNGDGEPLTMAQLGWHHGG